MKSFCMHMSFGTAGSQRRGGIPSPNPLLPPRRSGFRKDCEIALAISHKMVSSRTVKIHQNLTFRNNTNFFVGGAKRRPLIFPRQILSARRAQARLAVGQDEVRLPCDFNSVSDLLCLIILCVKRALGIPS